MGSRRLTLPEPFPDPQYSEIPQRPPTQSRSKPEQDALDTMLTHFRDDTFKLKVKEDSDELRELDELEKMFLSEETMLRYLKATKGRVHNAITRLEETLVWKRGIGLWDIEGSAAELAPEFGSGKVVLLGYTRKAQPILYTWTAKNDQPSSFRQVKHIMFCMDRIIDMQLAGVQYVLCSVCNGADIIHGGVMFCADVSGKTQTQSGAIGVSRQILNGLQAHYPERLGGAALLKMPWFGSLFVTLMWPFVDPETRKKIHVNPDLKKELVAEGDLLEEYGGELQFEWNAEYLPGLVKLCVERRQANLERWRKAGAKVGTSEWDFLEQAQPPSSSSIGNSATPVDEKLGATPPTAAEAATTEASVTA